MVLKQNKISQPLQQNNNMGYETKNPVIPLNIFQTWDQKIMPTHMKNCVDRLKQNNPEFKHFLFTEKDCQIFIGKYFHSDVLNAYNSLIPKAYKADLWRYCVLYIHGGVYLDIKYHCINGFKLITLMDKEHIIQDFQKKKGQIGILNAFLICKPRNQLLLNCIIQIVDNVKNKYYGSSALDPTGPGMMGKVYSKDKNLVKTFSPITLGYCKKILGITFRYNNKTILVQYPEYRQEQSQTKNKYYAILWNEKNIYK